MQYQKTNFKYLLVGKGINNMKGMVVRESSKSTRSGGYPPDVFVLITIPF